MSDKMSRFKTKVGWEGVLFFSFVGIAVLFLGFLVYILFTTLDRYDHPKTYGDTIEYLMRPIQTAKKEAIRLGDQERFEYWSSLEKELSEKSMEESMKGEQQ